MKRFLTSIFILLFVSVAGAEERPLMANDVLKNLNSVTNTSVGIKEYRQSIRDKQMEGTGIVIDVSSETSSYSRSRYARPETRKQKKARMEQGGDKQYSVFLYVGSAKSINKNDYNVNFLTTEDVSNIKVGQKLKFVGEIESGMTSSPARRDYPYVTLKNASFNVAD